MFHFSPLTVKRFRSFRRIRRAWYSLIAFAVVFVICMLADVICPYRPNDIIPRSTLKGETVTEKVYDIRTVRFNLDASGSVSEFEGPEDIREKLAGASSAEAYAGLFGDEYDIRETRREGYVRYYFEPKAPTASHDGETYERPPTYPYAPCAKHWCGLDDRGRDVLTLIVHGMRIGLLFGIALAISGMLIGLVIGAIEGYFGGVTDILCQRFTEIWSAIPFLYVMIFIGDRLGRGFILLLICYAIFNWISVSYYMRAEFLRLRMRTFVEAAKCQGFSARRIIFGHILPNALTPLVTLFPFLLMGSIGSLAALDFLGFGLPAMTPSCGELLKQAMQCPSAWWLIVFPSGALFIVMLLTVLIGEGLRDAFDPRQKSKLE